MLITFIKCIRQLRLFQCKNKKWSHTCICFRRYPVVNFCLIKRSRLFIYTNWLNSVINDHLDKVSRDKRKKRAMSQQLVEVFATSEDTSPIFEKKYVTGWNRKFVTGYFASYHKIPFVSNKDGPCISKWRCVINLTVYTESRWMVILHMTLWCSDLLCAYHCNLIFHPSHAICS